MSYETALAGAIGISLSHPQAPNDEADDGQHQGPDHRYQTGDDAFEVNHIAGLENITLCETPPVTVIAAAEFSLAAIF